MVNNFKGCMENYPNKKDALKCCLENCSSNDDQETCIDAYNSLIYVRENYLFGYRINRGVAFLSLVIIYHIFQLSPIRLNSVVYIIFIHLLLYYSSNYIF